MKTFLMAVILTLLLAVSSPAQGDYTMESLLTARAKLIHRYVRDKKFARGVAICGGSDLINDNGVVIIPEGPAYLAIYVYRDSMIDFIADFSNFATSLGGRAGYNGVDGIPVAVVVLGGK